MKREALTKGVLKLNRLARKMDCPKYVAVGILELIWHMTEQMRPAGDLGRGISNEEIAEFIGYKGDPDALIDLLIDQKWIDVDPVSRLIVHDWDQHCTDSVHTGLALKGELFANGVKPRDSKLNKEQRAVAQHCATLRNNAQDCATMRNVARSHSHSQSHGLSQEPEPEPEPSCATGRALPGSAPAGGSLAQAPGSSGSSPSQPPLVDSVSTVATKTIPERADRLAIRIETNPLCETLGNQRSKVRRTSIVELASKFGKDDAEGMTFIERAVGFIIRRNRSSKECKKLWDTLARFEDGLNYNRVEQASRLADEDASDYKPAQVEGQPSAPASQPPTAKVEMIHPERRVAE